MLHEHRHLLACLDTLLGLSFELTPLRILFHPLQSCPAEPVLCCSRSIFS